MEELAGRVAVVTGGASGIGLAMARRFAREGMAVAIADIDAAALDAAVTGLRDLGGPVSGHVVDVTDAAAVQQLAHDVVMTHGGVHVVCNNAGVGSGGSVLETSLEEWRWVIGVDLFGVVNGLHAFLPILVDQDEGHIVNTASVAGLVSTPYMAAYNAAKHGVVTLSETLYYELQAQDSHVGVSVLCPAWVRTRIAESDRLRPASVPEPGPSAQHMRSLVQGLTAEGRDPDDVAAMVVDAIRGNTFYVVTHKGMLRYVARRAEDIVEGRNPSVDQGI